VNEWTNDMPGIRSTRKQRKARKQARGSGSGDSSRGTTVGLALVFALPALAFFSGLAYCIYYKVAA
jgi:hypothetical protein